MKLCIHGHAMTPDNTGKCEYWNKQGRRYTLTYCKQCRRDSSRKFYEKHGRIRAYKRKKPDDEVKSLKPTQRLKCGQCPVTTATRELMDDHRRRFHSTWEDAQWIVRIEA